MTAPDPKPSDREKDFLLWFKTKLDRHLRDYSDDDKFACIGCDMGAAGWSSKGEGHHDDIEPDVCFLLDVKKALAAERRRVLEDPRITEILRHIRHAYSCSSLDEAGCDCGRNESLVAFKDLLKESQ